MHGRSPRVHELFHRVQYSYGYKSGTSNMKWAAEATASWSEKYLASHVGDWMREMNNGLLKPDAALTDRSYDACHFWVYLGQRGNGEKECVKLAWENYQKNGEIMQSAVESVVKARINSQYTFNDFVGRWAFANYHKDLTNAESSFDYDEDELKLKCGDKNYGPLASVPRISQTLNANSTLNDTGSVREYGGADYCLQNWSAGKRGGNSSHSHTTNFKGIRVRDFGNQRQSTYEFSA